MTTKYTAQDKLEAVQRELTMRRRVYEKFVTNKTMTREFADKQIDVFEEIREDYEAQVKSERLL